MQPVAVPGLVIRSARLAAECSSVKRRYKVMHVMPPRGRYRRGRCSARVVIHNAIAEGEELFRTERFGEEVGHVVRRGDEGHHDLQVFHAFSNEEVAPRDVLHARMVLRVVRDGDGRLVVDMQTCGLGVAKT
eukprot:2245614-Prymnesium_polylepis.1